MGDRCANVTPSMMERSRWGQPVTFDGAEKTGPLMRMGLILHRLCQRGNLRVSIVDEWIKLDLTRWFLRAIIAFVSANIYLLKMLVVV